VLNLLFNTFDEVAAINPHTAVPEVIARNHSAVHSFLFRNYIERGHVDDLVCSFRDRSAPRMFWGWTKHKR
jgi:hypothetical protein